MSAKINQENLNIFYGFACNYSCDGCTSGSDAVDRAQDPDLDAIFKVIPRLSEMFAVSNMITLIGGEPLLYWEDRVEPLAIMLRQHFPQVKINIFTNGQLLGKKLEKVIDLMIALGNVDITITRHVSHLAATQVVTKWHESIDSVGQHPLIVKLHDDHWHIINHVHNNLHFVNTDSAYWKSFYQHTSDGTIKPWATNDPVGSMIHGCTGSVCSVIVENRLYKCGPLAMLADNLKSRGQIDDPAWAKYINYPWIDVWNPRADLLQQFVDTYGRPTEYCDMCANKPHQQTRWQSRTYQMVFQKQFVSHD